MSKTVLTIAGIGAAGCLLLAMMMKQLVQHRDAQRPPACGDRAAARFASRLATPLALREEHVELRVRLVAHARAVAGEDRRQLADAIAAELWREALADERITEIEVVLRDPDGRSPVVANAPRAAAAR